MIDIPGLNYRTSRYEEAYQRLPQNLILGSETSSTVSSRGVYKLPVQKGFSVLYDDHQCSSYDLEACVWSNIPDIDLALAEDHDWTLGQFVWTGFDYLGEPSPYDKDSWPKPRPCSASSTWLPFPKTAIICIAVYGTKKRRPYIFFPMELGRA